MAKPERVFKAGPVRASIFRNSIIKDGREIPIPKVVLEVRFKDKFGQWKGTNSLSLNEVPKAIVALQSAYAYLLENRDPTSDSDTPEAPAHDFSYPPVVKPGQGNLYKAP